MKYLKANHKQDNDSLTGWLLPFADMVTFLMAFFVVLYTTVLIDEEKSKQLRVSISESMGSRAHSGLDTMSPNYDTVYTELTASLVDRNLDQYISAKRTFGGIKITASNELLFESGYDQLTDKARHAIIQIAHLVKDEKINIRIEGHTDDAPINTEKFPSNWELSTSRAIQVLRVFSAVGIDEQRLSVTGMAHTQPIAKPEGSADEIRVAREKNRRVVIFLH